MKHRYLWPVFVAGLVASTVLGWLIGMTATRLTASSLYAAEVAATFIAITIFYLVSRSFYRY